MNDLQSIFSLYRVDCDEACYLVLAHKNADRDEIKFMAMPEIRAKIKLEGHEIQPTPSNHPLWNCKVTELPKDEWDIKKNTDSKKAIIANEYKVTYKNEPIIVVKTKAFFCVDTGYFIS